MPFENFDVCQRFQWPFCRPFPEALYGATSLDRPLLGRRWGVADGDMGESIADLTPLERLLRCQHDDAHEALASVFWDR